MAPSCADAADDPAGDADADLLFESPHQPAPFVFENGETLSLHFDLQAVQSSMRRDAPHALTLDYTRVMMAFLLLAEPPRRVLMIGLGGGSLAKYCHRHLPQTALTVVEIDPQVIALRERFHIPPDDARLQIICADGAAVLRDTEPHWDMILVDGFDYDGQPEALCSPAFYADCRAALQARGLLVVNLQAEAPGNDPLTARIGAAFDGLHLSVPAEHGANQIVFASAAPRWRPGRARLQARWKQLDAIHQDTLAPVRERLQQALRQTPAAA